MDNLDWLDELGDISPFLSDDMKALLKIVDYKKFKELYTYFLNDSLNFTKIELNNLKKVYIRKFYNHQK